MQPKNALYRNNMATVLVEMNRMQEAYSHLRVVHSEPACYYNIGFLLNKKGKTQDAAQHFAMAYQLDPSMTQAKEWLERLGAPVPQPKPSMMAPRQSPPPPTQDRTPVHVSQRPLPPTTVQPRTSMGRPFPTERQLPPPPPVIPGNARGLDPLPADDMPPLPSDLGTPSRLPPVHDGLREPEIAPLPPVREDG